MVSYLIELKAIRMILNVGIVHILMNVLAINLIE